MLAKRFSQAHANHGFVKLLSVEPDRGDSLGGTEITIYLAENPFSIQAHATNLQCRFGSSDVGGRTSSTVYAHAPASGVDDSHVRCITPDFSAHFNQSLSTATFQEVYVQVTKFDGSFRDASEIRFRYYKWPEVARLSLWKGEDHGVLRSGSSARTF